MSTATLATINASQLATATDRLLAYGGYGKRRGPHVAHARQYTVARVERTVHVAPLPAPRRSGSIARRLVVVAALALFGGAAFGVHSAAHATTGVHAR